MTTNTRFKYKELALAIGLGCGLASAGVVAQSEEAEEAVDLGTYTTEGAVEDTMGLMPTEPVESVFGFDKTLLETPRGVTSVSAEMMENFNITDIDDLVLVSPGAFTQSFFGVAGSLDVRGTPGEVYFRGVRRLNNPGNYPTPIGASDRIDIVRGPASPIYGPSKVGGYLNFEPKSARAETGQYLEEPTGALSITRGSWDKNILTAEVGGPGKIGDKTLGYYVYAETENSDSYYDNSNTRQNIFQAAFNMDLTDKTRIEFGGMRHEFDGNQVAGWNRLTQELIDDGTYITGSPASVDSNNDGYNSPDEYDAWKDTFTESNFFVPPATATDDDMDPAWALQNPGTAKLEGNQVLTAPEDQLLTDVTTLFVDLIHDVNPNFSITNKLFYESLGNLNENAYGFSTVIDSYVVEDQLIFAFDTQHADWLSASYQISPSIRHTDFLRGQEFDFEYFDRRDLTGPSTALDRMLLATMTDSNYSDYLTGTYTNYALAFLADYAIGERLDLLLGARYDSVEFDSNRDVDRRHVPPASGIVEADESDDGVSWTASISYETPFGVTPYATLSEQSTIISDQGSEVNPDLIASGDAMAESELEEVGIKGSFLDDRLYVSAAWFNQARTNYNAQDLTSNNTTESEGYEMEARFLITENFTMTAAFTHLEVINLTALENGSQFSFLGAEDLVNVSDPSLFYGYVMQGLNLVSTEEEAMKAGVPENLFSVTGAYDFGNGFRATASATHSDSTYSGFSKVVELPEYTLLNAGISYSTDDWSLRFQVKNLTDERYFRANFPDLFGSTVVLPELPRHFSANLTYNF